MRLLSKIVFGDYFRIEKSFDADLHISIKRLLTLFNIQGLQVKINQTDLNLTWDDRSNKFQFLGTLTEKEGKTTLTGEFVLGTFLTIRYMTWLSFWAIGYILWEIGLIEFHREGDDIGFLVLIIVGLMMLIVFILRVNKKAKEIIDIIDEL